MKKNLAFKILQGVIIALLTPAITNLLTPILGRENSVGLIGLLYLCLFLYLVGEVILKIKNKNNNY